MGSAGGALSSGNWRAELKMPTWFIADTHFGKQPGGRCKWSGMSAGELDTLIEANWRDRVAENDVIWHLGDIGPDWRRLATLPGVKHLILGNDDKKDKEERAEIEASRIFETVRNRHRLEVDGGSLFLIHIPAEAKRKPAHEVIHGHLHHLPSVPGHRSVSVDRTGWAPQRLEELLTRRS